MQVFDKQNPYLQKSEEYQKQMKNLKYMLGLPFEITVKVDTEYLQVNDAKDDLKDDALKRDAFFASVHTVIALDVLKRMLPGMLLWWGLFFCWQCTQSTISGSGGWIQMAASS